MSSVSSPNARLSRYYRALDKKFPVRASTDYGNLVVPNGNSREPVHRWFHLKEAYSSRLLARVVKDCGIDGRDGLRVLDPFAGVGTTLISAADLVAEGDLRSTVTYGIEANPFLHLVAATKLAAIKDPPRSFIQLARKIGASALRGIIDAAPVPSLSTFLSDGFFEPADLDRLLRLKAAIDTEEQRGAEPLEIDLARLCLGAVVEAVSNLRRDGRALRRVDKQVRPAPVQAFLDKAHHVDDDLPHDRVRVRGAVFRGDGRLMRDVDGRFGPFDLVVFSPPYPNNIDYTEVYKLEAWLLGFYQESAHFSEQRLRTVYSHPSLLRPDQLPSDDVTAADNARVLDVIAPVVDAIPSDRYTEARRRMLRGYALDMFLTLRGAAARTREDGKVVYVVGNSVHGHAPNQVVIAADLLIAELAEVAGFVVERLEVARRLRRRVADSDVLRESVVFLRLGA